jgi:shikimate kinase
MMTRNHIVYIIGFMGSGKSTAGRKLASLLAWSYIDLDKRIEEHTSRTIPEIFSQNGEDYFRSIEAQLLRVATLYTHLFSQRRLIFLNSSERAKYE